MARIRSIKPGFWTDEKLAQFSPLVRLTFLGLISAMADDEGRCKGDVRLVKASVWPLDDDVTAQVVASHLDALTSAGRILVYEHDGARYIQIVNWLRHQKIDKARRSELPAPPDNSERVPDPSPTPPRKLDDASALDTDTEGDMEWKGSGAGEDPEDSAPFRSDIGLPKGALDLLAMFYEPALTDAQRTRYRDVCGQLWDTIDAKHPGPKIRGGTRVKARSVEHLERECRAVMRDPPRDRDMAIVFVLKRLTNPEPGPTPAERNKSHVEAEVLEQDAYYAAAKSAGIAWANDHREEYDAIQLRAVAHFRAAGLSDFSKMAQESEIVQECARAAGFTDFKTWRATRHRQGAA